MKSIFFALVAPMLMACGAGEDDNKGIEPIDEDQPTVNTTAQLQLDIHTDRALYQPGQTILFTAEGILPSGARVRYRQGCDVVADEALSGASWTWTAPQRDFTGYLADVYVSNGSTETIYGTAGVDVSSDWSRFPRYGFVATFDQSKSPEVINKEMDFLNRYHINGIQFYDWHYKHHWPLGGTREELMEVYTDIANREIYTSVVKEYIARQHALGMKSMFYNLCYGALDDAAQDGVDVKWGVFTNTSHNQDKHPLPSGWKGDIYLMDPSNKQWQQYLAERNDDVYANFGFDGFHIDQLGDRGTVYDYYGSQLKLESGIASFIEAMKQRHPNRSLVMNAVSGFAAEGIGRTGKTDFMYTEMWGGESKFSDVHDIISSNSTYSGGKNSIIAAYMNYGKSGSSGTFNTPGILLTDAVMFALGGAHLELGDGHMLCHEYFPNSNLKMSNALQSALVTYYDFLVAYENLLRDGGTESIATLTSGNTSVALSSWPPKLQTVVTYAKNVGGRQVIHLLNFMQANSLSWRDEQGTMPEPQSITSLPLRLKASGVKRLWVASPDNLGGAPLQLSFSKDGEYINFTLPSLKYWTMIVVE
ncbi:MAG: glycoside hydrolase family 66 protein [Bacteroidales bacterium]|nr:glycoside hydrolase family 66 protein [Bacteroidales bacterium]